MVCEHEVLEVRAKSTMDLAVLLGARGWGREAGGEEAGMEALTALPLGMAKLDVTAGPSRVLLGALGAADALDLVVEGLERGVHLDIVLPQAASGLVRPHVADGIGTLLWLTQASKS